MSDDSSQEEKQNFLRENILDKGYDTNMFVDFLMDKKGEGGADVGNWTMNDLKIVVKEFISMQSNQIIDSNPPQVQPVINNDPISTAPPVINNNPISTVQPVINNNPLSSIATPKSVKNDPLGSLPKVSSSTDPLQAPKVKIQNDPLQSKQSTVAKKQSKKFDPLSGGISQSKEPSNKQNSSMANFFSSSNQNKNNNINPQIQQNVNPNIQAQVNPQMQNQFNQQYFNQFPNYSNPLQQNQQFQPQMIQGQFPQFGIPNQPQQNNNIQNNMTNTQNINNTQQNQQNINQDIKSLIPQAQTQPQIQAQKNEVIKPSPEAQNKAPSPQKNNPQEGSKPNTDIGILYGIITEPTDESRVVDKTPLGIADNPSIQVGFPEKVEGGFFSKSYVTYLITTIPLNLKVRRRYSDFDWLRQMLTTLYVGNVIPTTPRKNKIGSDKFGDAFLRKRMRTLEKFLNYLLLNPIIKYSQLLYDFISIENEADFNKKKKEYEKMKPPQNINENQSLVGRINIEVKKEKEIFFENIKDNINFNESLLIKLNENLKLLKTQIENITLKIDEIALIWGELCKTSTKYFDGDDIIQTYDQMNKLFTNWSDALKRHNSVIHVDIREYFKYVKNNFKSMKDLVYIVETNKNTYNKNEKYLINKKEDLLRRGDMNKWELDAHDKDNISKLLQDKNAALMKIIPKETNNVINMKKTYGYYLNRIIDEYERLKSINSFLHKKNLSGACEKLMEIYGDFQKGTADIHNFFQTKSKNNGNINILKL